MVTACFNIDLNIGRYQRVIMMANKKVSSKKGKTPAKDA